MQAGEGGPPGLLSLAHLVAGRGHHHRRKPGSGGIPVSRMPDSGADRPGFGKEASIPGLLTAAEQVKTAPSKSTWDDTAAIYTDRDRDTHFSTRSEILCEQHGAGCCQIGREFAEPVRLFIDIETDKTIRRRPTLFIHGRSASGKPRIERIPDEQIRWMPGWGRATGRLVYSAINRIEVRGLEPDDRIVISSVGYNYQDHSHLTPLWAGIPREERARRLIQETMPDPERFKRPSGCRLPCDHLKQATLSCLLAPTCPGMQWS